jgi:hypothetical protein
MGILDDAIKEHLELKRQHGAADDELKQLEDEAFGASERPGDEGSPPDPLAEAPTEFMEQPSEEAPKGQEATGRPSPRAEIADLQEAPSSEPGGTPEPEEPAEEESPAMEHEAVPEPEPAPEPELSSEPAPPTGPTTEEREAIAEQPTEMYDIEEELASSQGAAPSAEEPVEEEMAEPRLGPADPLAEADVGDDVPEVRVEEEDDDFWDEKRLSDELDQALEAPVEVEEEEDEQAVFEPEPEPEPEEQPPARADEDVLEETPDFLEEAPEDDQLWFEQKPPKDFDFDD